MTKNNPKQKSREAMRGYPHSQGSLPPSSRNGERGTLRTRLMTGKQFRVLRALFSFLKINRKYSNGNR